MGVAKCVCERERERERERSVGTPPCLSMCSCVDGRKAFTKQCCSELRE